MLRIIISGKFEIKKNSMHIVAGILCLVYLLATIFSVYRYGSFWGQTQQMSESFIAVLCFLVFYFLVSNIFTRKNIFISTVILSISALVAEIVGVFQLTKHFLPFSFAKAVSFNTVGSVGSLGFFAAILLPLAIVLLIVSKKWWRALFIAEIFFSALILVLINYPMIWWVVIVGSALILVLGVIKSDLFDGRWMALPTFFLAVSLFFVLLNPQIPWLSQKTNETFLSQKTGMDIAISVAKERPIFGSGLGTFAYDFSKFKNPDFSKSYLWNITFNKSSSKVLNSFSTTGIFGFLALLAFMLFPIYCGIKFIIGKKEFSDEATIEKPANQIYSVLLLGLFVAIVEQSIVYFLYNSNMALDFIYFFSIAALIGLIFETKKEYLLKPSSLITLVTTLVFTLVFIFGLGILILGAQRYVAEVNYHRGISAYQNNQTADGLKYLVAAANLNSQSDLYFRQLAQGYFLALQDELQKADLTANDQEKAKIQTLIANSINAAKRSTDLNPKDVNNWSLRGYIYQNLLGISSDASTWAIVSYDSALRLDPNNPYLFAQEGNIYLALALKATADQADQKNQNLAHAQTQLEKAISLNPSYSNALYSLGLVYDYLGQNNKAIDAFTKLQQLNPANTDISAILANLQAGRPALQSYTPPLESPTNDSILPSKGGKTNTKIK